MVYDTGAYTESSWHMAAGRCSTGPYRWPAFDVVGLGVRTNRFAAGNYRAPTGPQLTHALETLIDELADRLGLDPVDLRLANLVDRGHPTVSGETWPRIGGGRMPRGDARHPIWARRAGLPAGEGIGLALGVWEAIDGAGRGDVPPRAGRDDHRRSRASWTSAASTSGFEVIAAETFGVPVDAVTVVAADTVHRPAVPGQQRERDHVRRRARGPAGRRRCTRAVPAIGRGSASRSDPKTSRSSTGSSDRAARRAPGRSVAEIAAELSDGYAAPVEGHASTAHTAVAPSAAGHLAHVRVDDETGQINLLDYAIVQDVGRALNPALVEDQMLGGGRPVDRPGDARGDASTTNTASC